MTSVCPGCGNQFCAAFGDECWYANGCPAKPPSRHICSSCGAYMMHEPGCSKAPPSEPYEVRYALGTNGFPIGHALVSDGMGGITVEPYEMGTSTGWFLQQCRLRGVDIDSPPSEPEPVDECE